MQPRLVLSIAAAVVAAPTTARAADPPIVNVYCLPGSTTQCFAAGFMSSGTTFTIWLQNLQGTGAAAGDTGVFDIGFIQVSRNNDGTPEPNDFMSYAGGCGHTGTAGAVERGGECFEEDSYAESESPARQDRTYFGSAGSGLVGCAAPASPAFYVARTCVAEGLDGWLILEATAMLHDATSAAIRGLTADDVAIRVGECDVHVGSNSGFTRDARPRDCFVTADYAAFVAVPEPGVIALVASGLLGLALVHRRRHGGR
jgi:hypothetical protein